MKNPHLQTILPRFYRKKTSISTIDEHFELPDGDFVELSWSQKPEAVDTKPIVIVFHGLGGSINSFYANGMMKAIDKAGWVGVLMHFRGCGKQTNRHSQAYHSGETGDATNFIEWLSRTFPKRPLAAVGFSLGGNMLAKYLGERGPQSLLDAAVVISAPLRLSPCANRMTQSFSRVYQKYLLDMLKVNMLKKLAHLKEAFILDVTAQQIKKVKTLREFDDLITGPLHGFVDANDYYEQCSGIQFLPNITTSTLIIHAADDPFMTHQVHPKAEELSSAIRYELSDGGGHVGFLHGKHPLKPQFWLEQRVPQFIAEQFALGNKP
jgi:predicted alpha/beta-fold hydrolase